MSTSTSTATRRSSSNRARPPSEPSTPATSGAESRCRRPRHGPCCRRRSGQHPGSDPAGHGSVVCAPHGNGSPGRTRRSQQPSARLSGLDRFQLTFDDGPYTFPRTTQHLDGRDGLRHSRRTWPTTSSSSTTSSSARSSRSSSRTTTSASSTTGGRTPAPTGIAAACPNEEWEALLHEARRRADAAGHYRYPFPKEYGGKDGTNLGMAVIREHLAPQGPRPALRPAERARDRRQQRRPAADDRTTAPTSRRPSGSTTSPRAGGGFAFGITEPEHGSDATHMETHARSATATSGSSTARRRGTPASTPRSTT